MSDGPHRIDRVERIGSSDDPVPGQHRIEQPSTDSLLDELDELDGRDFPDLVITTTCE